MKTDAELYQFAAEMREKPTLAELAALGILTGAATSSGGKFEHQFVFGHFILDFAIPERLLVIELDGSAHNGNEEYDFQRDLFCKRCGLSVLRIKNSKTETLPQLLKSFPVKENWRTLWAAAVTAAVKAREIGDAPSLSLSRANVVKGENVKKKRKEARAKQSAKERCEALGPPRPPLKRQPKSTKSKLSKEAKEALAKAEVRSPVLARRKEEGRPTVPFVNPPEPQPEKPKKGKYDIFSHVKKAQGKLS